MATNLTIRIPTRPEHADHDDVLAAVAAEYVEDHPELEGWDLSPRWDGGEDGQREAVLLDVPAWAAYARTGLTNYARGVNRAELVLCPGRMSCPAASSEEIVPALETGGLPPPQAIDISGTDDPSLVPLADALAALGCTLDELRAECVRVYPPAAEWDWASEED